MEKLIYGVAINDCTEKTTIIVDGKRKVCPYYTRWMQMLRRCYDPKLHKQFPTYIDCTVCEEWLTFSNFKTWMKTQDWEGKTLDKDFISDKKVYSPETCIFIDNRLNSFLALSSRSKIGLPIGVHIRGKKYRASINTGRDDSTKSLGTYNTALEAHQAWQRAKIQLAINYQESNNDVRVKDGLQRIINLLTEDLNNNRITTHF